jgi:hypothetical protein
MKQSYQSRFHISSILYFLLISVFMFGVIGCADSSDDDDDDSGGGGALAAPVLTAPIEATTTADNTPTFSWTWSDDDTAGDWCYALVAADDPNALLPDLFLVLDKALTSYDMSAPPANVTDWGAAISGGAAPAPATLASGDWGWSVLVVDCAYDDTACLGEADNLGSADNTPLASSEAGTFTVP